jgi:glycosyltransferase involved in cell wall biosynthesis
MKASGPSGGLCQSVLDAVYGRSIAAALSDAPLAFGDRQSAQRVREPQGIVMACPTLVAGGAERQIVNTAIGLHKQGLGPITVLVARLHNPPGNAFFLRPLTEAGVNVREARANESALKRWLDTRALAATTEGARTLALLGRLPQAIRQEVLELGAELSDLNPAVVHCWLDYSNVRAGLAAVCAGVPRVVLSGRNVGPQHFPYIFEPFMRSAYRALLECPNLVLANNSRGGAQDYAEWLRVEPARIPVIYNGLDLALGDPPRPSDVQHLRATLSIPEHAPVVGGMFRFSPEKRPMLWLQVVDRILREQPDCQFVLFGEGNLKARMVAEIRRLSVGDRVRLVPPTQQSRTALAMFDLLLLTSQWEGTPNVAIEAQALRTPVVLTGGGGAKEAIAAGTTGLYVEDAQPANLANAVLTLLSDPPCRKNMAMSGPEFVERRFGIEGMLSRTRRTYQTCDSG